MSPMIVGEAVVLRRVDAGDARRAEQATWSASGMIPPTTTGASTPGFAEQPHRLGHELEVRAREDRQPDHVDVLVARGGRDLLRA